jgi:hypothetical protein
MTNENEHTELQDKGKAGKIARGAIQAVGGGIPFASGIFSAIAGAWSENEQEKANRFFEHWIQMLKDELKEKEQTIIEIMARLDLQDEEISKREKRVYIRNILSNAASANLTDDDVIKLFIDWINQYSELHFQVIAAIYNSGGISRGSIWRKIEKGEVREDSAEADLYKLLFRDLSTGGIVRQHRETDYYGNFLVKPKSKPSSRVGAKKTMKSAFDQDELYELTELGQQFIHYAMTDLPLRIEMGSQEESKNS